MKKKHLWLNLSSLLVVILIHIVFVFLFISTKRYINLNRNIYFSIFGILICLLILVDFLFLISSLRYDKLLKTLSLFLGLSFLILGAGVIYGVSKINATLERVVDSGVSQHEKLIVNFVSYDNDKIKELEDLKNQKIGILHIEDEVGVVKLGKDYLTKNNIDVKYQEYNTFLDMMLALINKDIQAVIVDNTYKSQLKTNEGFEAVINKFKDIESFEEKVLVGNNDSANKDIVNHPFTVLLIGYAPEPGGGGLADSIILASINPQDLMVTFTSIPRDSFVPISCYNNKAKDKITHARGISRNCLINSVADLFDVKIDFYAEINFKGIVDVVDALGGIVINSPIEFVGQNSDTERGNMTVWIGKGFQLANGEQALAFARERKQMPNGDFDRQNHQQQVIKAIVKKLVEVKDVNKLLNVIEIAGDNFATNLNINQMISMFNHLSEIKVYNGLSSFENIIFNNMRLAGYSSWSYNFGMQQALWVYPIYQGSILENRRVIDETLAKTNRKQYDRFKFEWRYLYEYRKTYSTEFPNEAIVHEEMPDVLPNFTNMSLAQARSWASERGINLVIDYVKQGDSRWFENGEGTILDQAEASRPGLLVANVSSVYISAIDSPRPEDLVPNFTNWSYNDVLNWVNNNGYAHIKSIQITTENRSQDGLVKSQDIPAGSLKTKYNELTIEVYKYEFKNVSANALNELNAGIDQWTVQDVTNWKNANLLGRLTTAVEMTSDASLNGKLKTFSFDSDPVKENSSLYAVFYSYVATENPKPSDENQTEDSENQDNPNPSNNEGN